MPLAQTAKNTRLLRKHALLNAFLVCLALLTVLAACSDNSPTEPMVAADSTGSDHVKTRTDTFILRAYDLDAVYVASSINGWVDEDPEWSLTLQEDGYTWRLIKTHETNIYYYKFIIHAGTESAWLTDPAATEVSPSGSSGSPAYWNAVRGRTFTEPRQLGRTIDRSKLVIYEISLNDFSATGTFSGARSGLTSAANLADLGVNAIELLPVTAPSYNGWGYDPVLQFAPNPSFGWPSTFASLVDEAHELDIAVILDVVINHMAGSAPLRQLDDFTGTNHFTTEESNPWGLVELNWTDPALREHILEALLHWVEAYHVDGFRFDYVGGEPYSTWYWLKNQLESRHPDLLLIAEDFNYPTNSISYGYGAQWGGNHTDGWGGGGNNFCQVMVTALTEAGFASRGQLSPEVGAFGPSYNNMWAVANVVGGNSNYVGPATGDGFSDIKYLESHDENRLVWAVDAMGSPGAQVVGGQTKARLGAVVSMTSVGIPMLFNGQEIGSDEYRSASPTNFPINFTQGDQELRDIYRRLIQLRLELPALASENTFFHWRDGNVDQQEYTMVYWRGENQDSSQAEVVVALNFDHQDHTWFIPFPRGGYWSREDLAAGSGNLQNIPEGGLTLTIPASSAVMWTNEVGITHVP
jgi:1,4-alpha-glucan branching enzyme